MSEPNGADDEALRRLDVRLDAAAARQVRRPMRVDVEGSSVGYRLIAELIGGLLAGVGLGWLADHALHTTPVGIVVGVLVGAVGSIVLAVRTATRMSKAASPPARAVGEVEQDRDR